MSRPRIFLARMVIFVVLIGVVVVLLYQTVGQAYLANPWLNGLIIAVLVLGIGFTFRSVTRLEPEVQWIETFRRNQPGLSVVEPPTLLAPMATMLGEHQGRVVLSATGMTTLLDGIGSRLDETRETSRYLIGLLIFLGLLGTFWGLLLTMSSVSGVIQGLEIVQGDLATVFEDLKAGLAAPLTGMNTAFSTSLFGLAGSLVLGFLDLQAGQAMNRFYNELEEWLSGITELSPGESGASDVASRQLISAVYEMHRAVDELAARLADRPVIAGAESTAPGVNSEESVRELARGVSQLVTQMRSEQKVVREWVDEQSSQQAEVTGALKELAANLQRRAER